MSSRSSSARSPRRGPGAAATVLLAGEAGIGKTRLVSEFAERARDAGFEVLLGRSLDLAGTELPYQPFADALGDTRRRRGRLAAAGVPGRRSRLIAERASAAPVLLCLEDLHWADPSTLDLVVFLAHNLDNRPVLLVGDLPSRRARVSGARPAARRGRAALELGARARARAPRARRADRAARGAQRRRPYRRARERDRQPAPRAIRSSPRSCSPPPASRARSSRAGCATLLLQRVSGLDDRTQGLLRMAAVAGRDVTYPLLLRGRRRSTSTTCAQSLRGAVEHGVLVAEPAPAASASATRCWPRRSTRRSCRASARTCTRGSPRSSRAAAPRRRRELAPHWAAAGRAARRADRFGRGGACGRRPCSASRRRWRTSSARSRCGTRCPTRPSWRASPRRAVRVGRRARQPHGRRAARSRARASGRSSSPARPIRLRAALLHERLGGYLFESGSGDTFLAAVEHAVELVPAEPPSPERARVLTALAGDLSVVWRYDESLAVCEEALALARGSAHPTPSSAR